MQAGFASRAIISVTEYLKILLPEIRVYPLRPRHLGPFRRVARPYPALHDQHTPIHPFARAQRVFPSGRSRATEETARSLPRCADARRGGDRHQQHVRRAGILGDASEAGIQPIMGCQVDLQYCLPAPASGRARPRRWCCWRRTRQGMEPDEAQLLLLPARRRAVAARHGRRAGARGFGHLPHGRAGRAGRAPPAGRAARGGRAADEASFTTPSATGSMSSCSVTPARAASPRPSV